MRLFPIRIILAFSISVLVVTLERSSTTIVIAAQEGNQDQIDTVKVTDSVYMLVGRGGNIGVSVGDDGVLLIDTKFAELKQNIETAIADIAPHPIRFILNTNWHFDHALGNAGFAQSGAIVIAHEASRVRMLSEQSHPDLDRTIPPYPRAALPVITVKDSLTLHFNGEAISVFHIPNAHSDGDLAFYFPKVNVMHTGDLYFSHSYPYIDVLNGGSIDGMIAATDRLIGMIDEETKVIPGHGPLSNKVKMREYREMLAVVRDRVGDQMSRGESLEKIVNSNLTDDFDEVWNGLSIRDLFVDIVYRSLSSQQRDE